MNAPAAIQLIREAEEEPAESISAVEGLPTTTRSMPSSVRTTRSSSSAAPWPTSAAAHSTRARRAPSGSAPTRTRAVVASSKPPE